jgi:hypothetical protein
MPQLAKDIIDFSVRTSLMVHGATPNLFTNKETLIDTLDAALTSSRILGEKDALTKAKGELLEARKTIVELEGNLLRDPRHIYDCLALVAGELDNKGDIAAANVLRDSAEVIWEWYGMV